MVALPVACPISGPGFVLRIGIQMHNSDQPAYCQIKPMAPEETQRLMREAEADCVAAIAVLEQRFNVPRNAVSGIAISALIDQARANLKL